MSKFTVCRSWSGYCLLLDDDRIAGGKPDYHEGNVFYEWKTRDTYGPVDELKAENAKLRELVRKLHYELDAAAQYEAGGSHGIVSLHDDA